MTTVHPLVSVVTPVYRSEDILARAVGSLLAQDFRDWEAIFIDDGSPEHSWRVVQAYSWIDPRIRTARQVHGGACRARNAGIAEARGEFVLFLDADDWMEPDAIGAMVNACQKNGWAAVHGALQYVKSDGLPTFWRGGYTGTAELFEAIADSNVISVPSAAMVRKSVFDQIGLFDSSLVHCGDWDLWARLARLDAPFGRLDQVVTNYRMRPGSLSRSPRTLLRDAMTTMRRIHAPDDRVLRPQPQFVKGSDRGQLMSRICHFAAYCAGLAISGRGYEAAEPVLDLVGEWTELSPQRAGEMVFYAMCFAHCCGPESVAEFWPDVVEPLHLLLADLERRTGCAGLGEQMLNAIDGCCEEPLESLPLPLPEPLEEESEKRSESFRTAHDTLPYDLLRSLASL